MDATEWELRTQELATMRELNEEVRGVKLELRRFNLWLGEPEQEGRGPRRTPATGVTLTWPQNNR